MTPAKNTFMYFKLYRSKLNTILTYCGSSFTNKCCFSQIPTFQLVPQVEQQFDSGTLKHRKHPGVNKTPPIILAPELISAVDRLLSKHNEKCLLENAEELLRSLYNRRLPMESDELEWRVQNILKKFETENEPKPLSKVQQAHLKKAIKSEMKRWKEIEYDHFECLTYLVGRIAPNYASVYKVLNQIKTAVSMFQPKTFFDFGSGVGSAVWAAHSIWGESLQEYLCVDASSDMIKISESLLVDENSKESLIKNVHHRQFLPASDTIKYDVVVSAFSMLDLPSTRDRLRVIDILWRKTNDMLVIIDFGNISGFHCVLDARDYILQVENQSQEDVSTCYSSGAHVLMPCPHELQCPMLHRRKQSCGTYVPYESLFPRQSKNCKKEWISYVVLRKGHKTKDACLWPRIVMPVLKRSNHVHCRVCCSDGILNELVVTRAKHGRHGYRCARSSNIGDLLPINIEQSTDLTDCQKSEKNEDV